ncbi:hypothetical protein [uncultured Oscillibacter sp.]|jgi:hypothetical protein|uniref:hypothetical protein n=1 Tax=uncultured Oscillibacter sp. TaxID=876091 RepID=UPI0025FC87C5|nr:hypothetical protein [uncultured Oscillibacter sp.]
MRRKRDTIKLLAILATGLGFAATLLSDWANSKEQEALIEEKVNEALAKRDKEENEDEEES